MPTQEKLNKAAAKKAAKQSAGSKAVAAVATATETAAAVAEAPAAPATEASPASDADEPDSLPSKEAAAVDPQLAEDARALLAAAADVATEGAPTPPAGTPPPPVSQAEPKPVNRMVTVCARRHLSEDGRAYSPGMKFQTDERRAQALAGLVDLVPVAPEATQQVAPAGQ